MANVPADLIRDYLTRLSGALQSADDDTLLARYFARQDPDAFAALLHRHGPMVLGVCRRVLGQEADAEDAFQSTFLVLARRGEAIRRVAALPAWLHRVAQRVALRALARRRTTAPLPDDHGVTHDHRAEPSWREVMSALDEEIDRLPDRLRAPLVLCYLDGLTRDEAAKRLGWSLNTVRRRIEAGRDLLKSRLATRGVAPLLLGATVLSVEGLRVSVAAALSAQTLTIVTGGVVPATVTALAEGVAAGSRFHLMIAASVVLVAGVAGVAALWHSPASPPPEPIPDPNLAASTDPAAEPAGDPLPAGARARFGTTRFRTVRPFHTTLSPDGRLLLTEGTARSEAIDIATGRQLFEVPSTGDATFALGRRPPACFTADGRYLVTHQYSDLDVYHAQTGRKVRTIPLTDMGLRKVPAGTPKPPLGLRPAGGARVLVEPTTVPPAVYDIDSGDLIHTWPLVTGQGGIALSVGLALLPDGDGAQVFDVVGGRSLGRLPAIHLPAPDWTWSTAFRLSPDERSLFLSDSRVKLVAAFSLPSLEELFRRDAASGIFSVATPPAPSSDGRWVYVGGKDQVYRLDARTGRTDREYRLPRPATVVDLPQTYRVQCTPDGATVLANSPDGVIFRWDAETGREHPPPPGFGQHVWGVFSMSGTRVALTDAFGRLEVSDTRGGKAKMLREAGPAIAALRWASNDTRLIAFHYDLFCTTWDPATGKVVASFQAQGPAIVGEDRWTAGVSIHPAGASVVVSDQLGTLACYDTASGKVNWQTRFARSRVVHTPDGRHFLVQDRSDPGTRARLYDAATGAPVRELPFRITAKTGMDAPFVYSPDGKYLVTADAVDFMIRFLEPDTGKVVHAFRAPRRSAAEAFAVSPDGSTVAVGCENGLLRTYAVATGQLLSERPAHRSMVTAVRYSSDGRSILTCSDDLTALLWDATPAPSPKR